MVFCFIIFLSETECSPDSWTGNSVRKEPVEWHPQPVEHVGDGTELTKSTAALCPFSLSFTHSFIYYVKGCRKKLEPVAADNRLEGWVRQKTLLNIYLLGQLT